MPKVIVSLDGFDDTAFSQAIVERAYQSWQNEPEESVIETVQSNGPSNLEIELKEGMTETAFWLEVFKFALLDGDALDNFVQGKPITE